MLIRVRIMVFARLVVTVVVNAVIGYGYPKDTAWKQSSEENCEHHLQVWKWVKQNLSYCIVRCQLGWYQLWGGLRGKWRWWYIDRYIVHRIVRCDACVHVLWHRWTMDWYIVISRARHVTVPLQLIWEILNISCCKSWSTRGICFEGRIVLSMWIEMVFNAVQSQTAIIGELLQAVLVLWIYFLTLSMDREEEINKYSAEFNILLDGTADAEGISGWVHCCFGHDYHVENIPKWIISKYQKIDERLEGCDWSMSVFGSVTPLNPFRPSSQFSHQAKSKECERQNHQPITV